MHNWLSDWNCWHNCVMWSFLILLGKITSISSDRDDGGRLCLGVSGWSQRKAERSGHFSGSEWHVWGSGQFGPEFLALPPPAVLQWSRVTTSQKSFYMHFQGLDRYNADRISTRITWMHLCLALRVGGSIPVIFSYFSEFQPRLRRGAMISALATFWMAGNILAAGKTIILWAERGAPLKYCLEGCTNLFLSIFCCCCYIETWAVKNTIRTSITLTKNE